HFDGHLGAYLGGRLAFVAGLVSQRSGLSSLWRFREDVRFLRAWKVREDVVGRLTWKTSLENVVERRSRRFWRIHDLQRGRLEPKVRGGLFASSRD
ncbi:MAG: hypothetical protein ABGW98_08520, partial [Myxococcales bacterium]